jgi:hypothetical protein
MKQAIDPQAILEVIQHNAEHATTSPVEIINSKQVT